MIKWEGLGSQFLEDQDKEGEPGAAGAEDDGSSAEPSREGSLCKTEGVHRGLPC